MKRVILMAIGSALLLPSQAQIQNKKYTNCHRSEKKDNAEYYKYYEHKLNND